MSDATCAVLATVYPIILLALIVDRNIVHLKVRRRRWYRWTSTSLVLACAAGIILSVSGVERGGYDTWIGTLAWVVWWVAILGFGFVIGLAHGTAHLRDKAVEEDG